jgi:HSP20 family protein
MLPMLPTILNEAALANRASGEPAGTSYVPAFDCYETPGSWELLVDTPGVAKEDLKVTVEPGELTIRGSRKSPGVPEGAYRHAHRWTGEFVRTFRLGDGLDLGKVEASLEGGVLRVSIAKAESAKARVITIR